MIHPQDVLILLKGKRYLLHNEKDLQGEIGQHLVARFGIGPVLRELELDRGNIIDFLIEPGIGIEIKIKGGKRAIYRQCVRYCQFPEVKSLILITNLSMGFPEQINGKDCYVLKLGTAWL